MEYVPGHTLRDVIRKESPMPAAKALLLIEPILSALSAAHGAGLIHRDIKPENILIATDAGSAAGSRSPTSAWPRRSAQTPSTPRPAAC